MKLPLSILTAGANRALPALPVWQAASFWAQFLMALSVVLNVLGIDLFSALRDMGLGNSPEEVLATGERAVSAVQQLLPMIFGLWAWIERRAPRYRLTLFGRGD